jgi:membrane peptidoglycan carboxypeptidase
MAGTAGLATVVARTELPQVDPLQQSTFVCDATIAPNDCNSQNAMAAMQGGEDRSNVRYEDIPPAVIEAVVATEDRDFFEHRGIDPVGIGRALYRDLRGGGASQGGSTITQQYVKNAFLTSERAITRKLREAVLAVKLEQRMSKEEILEGYLNTIYFGRGAYGVAAASQEYFGKPLSEIGVAEAAYLAGLIRAPVLADATNHPEEAERRRHVSLVAMEEEGYITEEQRAFADAVAFAPPYFRPAERRQQFDTRAPMSDQGGDYITHYVNRLLTREPFNLTEQEIFGGGYRVYTSIDPQMQEAAWNAVYQTLPQQADLVGAMAAVDDQGLIRAMVGGRDFNASQVNYAAGVGTDGMQVGSAFKPIALAEFIAQGKALRSTYNAPGELEIQQEAEGCAPTWTVHNYEESEGGTLDVRAATEESSNTAYGQMMWDLGPENVIEMAETLGMTGDISPACGPVVLGTELSTPLEMASIYSVFANQGMKRTPSIITRVEQVDQDGNVNVVYERQMEEQRVLDERQANTVTDVLQGVISNGTGTGADIGRPAAGKTGTAQANRDAWFVGYVPKLTAAVWMGYTRNDWDDPDTPEVEELRPPMAGEFAVNGRDVTGGSFPAQIWAQFMRNVADHNQWNDPFPEVPAETLEGGEIMGTTVPPQTTTTMPQGTIPVTPPQNSTTTTSPDSTTSSSSTIPGTTDTTTGPTFTLPTTEPPSTEPPGGGGNDQ